MPSGRSKEAHGIFVRNEAVFISLDVETAGEEVGVVQLSAEISRLGLVRHINKKGKQKGKENVGAGTATNIRRDPEVFNAYVKPSGDEEWCSRAISIHGLTPNHPSIVGASNIATVWEEFVTWVERKIDVDETAILVAYHGETCDLKWIWKLTQAPHSSLSMPDKIKLFLDPHYVMRKYKSCKLHPSKSKTDGLALGTVWSFLNDGELLEGQHDSLVGCPQPSCNEHICNRRATSTSAKSAGRRDTISTGKINNLQFE